MLHRRRSFFCSRAASARTGIASMTPKFGIGTPERRLSSKLHRRLKAADVAKTVTLGSDLRAGELPQAVVPARVAGFAHARRLDARRRHRGAELRIREVRVGAGGLGAGSRLSA
jgi:hypothetical protein